MAFAMIRFLARGWVEELYLQPTFFFSYEFFPWVRPLPALAMHGLFVLLAGLALAVALGWCYRPAIALFFVGFTYVELIDKTTYLNHYYLVSLLSGLMIFLPCHRVWSLDAARRGWTTNPVVPGWPSSPRTGFLPPSHCAPGWPQGASFHWSAHCWMKSRWRMPPAGSGHCSISRLFHCSSIAEHGQGHLRSSSRFTWRHGSCFASGFFHG